MAIRHVRVRMTGNVPHACKKEMPENVQHPLMSAIAYDLAAIQAKLSKSQI